MSYAGKRVLVTGADGFIGSHLVEALLAGGSQVTALAFYNSFDSHGWLDDIGAKTSKALTLVRGDIRDGAFVARLVEGHDLVFHLAALIAIPYSYEAPHSYVETNVTGTLNILEAARRHGVGRVVHTSTSEVYGTAQTTPISEDHPLQGQSPYSASKVGADMMAEAYARSFDLPVAILRPFNTYGPRQSERAVIPTVIRQVLDPTCEAIRIGDPTPTRDFTWVGDTVTAFMAVGTAAGIAFGSPYNAGTGRMVSIGEVVQHICRIVGTQKPVETETERLRPTKSEVKALLADSSRLTAAAGWRAATALEDGLARTIDWWRPRLEDRVVRRSTTYAT